METPKRRYKVLSVVGKEVEAENVDVAAVEFMEHVLIDQHDVIDAVTRQVVVTDEETGEETRVTLEELRERYPRFPSTTSPWPAREPPAPVTFNWPGWLDLLFIGLIAIIFCSLDAGGTSGGEWIWDGRKFAKNLPLYAAYSMAGFLVASLVNYYRKRKKNLK